MPGGASPDPEYVAARRVLLDALEALGAHRKSVVLVGAQAIYLHAGEGDLADAPYTTDGDLAIDPRELDDQPALAATLEAAGFQLAVRPGTWSMSHVQIDLLVPASLGGAGRRGARLGTHGSDVARKAAGLEAAVVDQALHRVASLDPADARTFDLAVAGLPSLLVAKLHKIAERKDNAERSQDKDSLDVLRMLRFAETNHLAETLMMLTQNPIAGAVSQRARGLLDELFGHRERAGARMAARASVGLEDSTAISISCEALAQRLLAAWKP
jgi:hypothetical protein